LSIPPLLIDVDVNWRLVLESRAVDVRQDVVLAGEQALLQRRLPYQEGVDVTGGR
jgi:hypothetical protein